MVPVVKSPQGLADTGILQMVAEQSPNAIIVTDAERRIIYVNRSFTEITGYPAEEAVGKRAGFMASGETPRATFAELNAALAEGKAWKGQFFNRHRDGRVRIDFAHVAPIRQDDGCITHYVSIQEDVTERKRLGEELDRHRHHLEELVAERTRQLESATAAAEHSSKLLREAVNSLPQGFAIMDPEGRLLLCNEAHIGFFEPCRDLLVPGATAESIFKAAVERGLLPEALGQEEGWVRQRLEKFERAKGEPFELKLADGRWLLVHEAKTPSGYKVGNRTDITELKHIQEELIAARDAANAASLAKGLFLANMSHEIRTPMNAIIGLAHLCLQTPLTPKQRDYVAKIDSAANMLLGIINNILDFSKIEAGKLTLDPAPFYLEEELSSLIHLLQPLARQKGVELGLEIEPDVPGCLVGDSLRLRQVLSNLVGNAIKFSSRGEIVVHVACENPGTRELRLSFSVSDQGIGMQAEQLESLFSVFTQADSSITRRYGGTGLGLAICKELVEIMGGRISAESRPEVGSTFRFSLPFALGPQETRAQMPDGARRALLVEDDRIQHTIILRMMEDFGFQVVGAKSGEEALALAEQQAQGEPFGLVLMDLRLPGIDGIETIARLRKLPAFKRVPVVLVTGVDLSQIHELQENNIELYLFKPVRRSVLFDAVQNIFPMYPGGARMTPLASRDRTFAGKRVLLAEDNEFNMLVGKELVEMHGATVVVAANGLLAIEALEREDFDLVLMDMQMPVMDGVSATQAIRSNPRLARLPIIAMTANVLAEERERCLSAGMNDFIAKPIVPHVLFNTLARWLGVDAAGVTREVKEMDNEQVPGKAIDLAAGLFHAGGQRPLYARLLKHFAETRRDAAEQLRQSWRSGDPAAAQRLVHTIKGSAATLGARALAATAAALDSLLKQGGDAPTVEALISELADRLAAVVSEIPEVEQNLGAD